VYALIMTIMLTVAGNANISNTTLNGFTSETSCTTAAYMWAGRVNEGLPTTSVSIISLCVKQ
jgi:hypothetical protein